MGKHAQPPPDCPACDGKGTVMVTTDGDGTADGDQVQKVKCGTCKGSGKA